jgi:MFS family permease
MARLSLVSGERLRPSSSRAYTLVIRHHRYFHLTSVCLTRIIGSQVILYFTGGSLSFITEDLGITQGSAWLPTANILAIAATCPFAGYLQDLFGKRYIALFGSTCICIGIILMATAHSFAQALAGMTISGIGAAIGELTGLAG